MRKFMQYSLSIGLLLVFSVTSHAQENPWGGQWISSKGVLNLKQEGNEVSGSIGKDGTFEGTVDGKRLNFEMKLGREQATGTAKIQDTGLEFKADVNSNTRQYKFTAVKKNENPNTEKPKDFSGLWLSSLGTLVLEQDGTDVEGKIGPEGWSTVNNGKVAGTRLEFDYVIRNFKGKAWLEQTEDGKRLFGLLDPDKDATVWTGVRAEGYKAEVDPKAGETVQGIASNGMLYNLRMPDGWKAGDKVDAIVLLHGSNFTTNGMVFRTKKNWPEIGKKFAIIGIQGQNWNKHFNYTYVNWVGRSTMRGFPYTHRESPYLISVLLDEFKKNLSVDRVFVGGHSQGGFLTHVLHMHFPEKISGTFPMAGGVITLAEPDVFDDEDLMKDQRKTPMFLMHGKKDGVVDFGMSERAYRRFLAFGFPRVKFHAPNRGHPYDFLPVDEAIEWLDMMTTKDAKALEVFGKKLVEAKKWRDVGQVIERAKAIEGGPAFSAMFQAYEAAAKSGGERLLKQIEENKNGKWIKRYLEWEEQFSLSSRYKGTIDAFKELQEEHEDSAKELYSEARKAFNQGKRSDGFAKYQEIVEKYYASTYYRTIKATLDKQK